jgi:hypothetical protein
MYEGEEGKNLGLKNFTIDHLSSFEPALFLDLANEWPALKEWDDSKLKEAFGAENDYEMLYCESLTVNLYLETCLREYRTYENFTSELASAKDYRKIYHTRGGSPIGPRKHMLLELDIPAALAADITEPKVTEQILDLKLQTMSIY